MPTLRITHISANFYLNNALVDYDAVSTNNSESTVTVIQGQSIPIRVDYSGDTAKFSRYWGSSNIIIGDKTADSTTITITDNNMADLIVYSKFKVSFEAYGNCTITAQSELVTSPADPDRKADEWNNISGLSPDGFGWFEGADTIVNAYDYKLRVTCTPVAPYSFYEWRGSASGVISSKLINISSATVYAITAFPINITQNEGGTISDKSGVITNNTTKTITKTYPYGQLLLTATLSPGYTISGWTSNTRSFYVGEPTLRPNETLTITFVPTGVVCFLGDTPILTPSGYTPIHRIHEGGFVITADGRAVRVRRVLKKKHMLDSRAYPYIIAKGMFGALQDIAISPNHEVHVPGKGMMKACALDLERKQMRKPFHYYNLELENWVTDNLVAAGVECESLAPTERIVLTKAEFVCLVRTRYGPAAARRLRTVCFEESSATVSMPKFSVQ